MNKTKFDSKALQDKSFCPAFYKKRAAGGIDQLIFAANQNIKEREYWLKKLSGSPVKVHFPYDYKKTGDKGTKKLVKFRLTGERYSHLMKVANKSDARLHMILVSSLFALLYRYSGSSDIIIGTTVYKAALEGQFINTVLALRNRVEENTTFKEMLLQLKDTITEADKHQDYPIEILVEQLNMPVSGDEFPLFDMAIVLENIQDKEYLRPIYKNINMVFSFLRTDDCIEGAIEYNPLLYRQDSVHRLAAHLTALLTGGTFDPGSQVSRIEILSGQEKRQLLVDFNTPYAGDFSWQNKTLHGLYSDRVKKTPWHTAVKFKDKELSFNKLDETSNRLAAILRKKGVKRDHIVGLMMDYSLEMIIGILAILKAGGAYLPIAPDSPRKRILTILNDSGVKILVTTAKQGENFSFTTFLDIESSPANPVVTAARPQIKDIDGLQPVDRSLIDYRRYLPFIGQSMVKNSISLQFSRGCAYNCAFCFKIWSGNYVCRSGENMFEEILFYYKMGIRRFGFVDDLPNLNVKESSKLYRLIIKNKLHLQLHYPNGIRGDILDKDYIDLMVAAGTITMDLALETTSPRLQRLIKKNLNLEKLHRNMQYIMGKYPHVILGTQLLHGIPTETEEEARASLDYLQSLKWLHFVYIHLLKIYPNTAMAHLAMAHGISREAIEASAALGYHQLPETLPFPKSFTRQYQAEFLKGYFLSKERLLHVLPYQMKALSEDELVQKYNSYLPVVIRTFPDFLNYAGIDTDELQGGCLADDYGWVPDIDDKLKKYSSHSHTPGEEGGIPPLKILLLDLSQHFSHQMKTLYEVVEVPLGLMYLAESVRKRFGTAVKLKIAKSRINFDNYNQLKALVHRFKPDIIGARTLNFYKEFFHKTLSLIRLWGVDVPIIAGGPYATGSYQSMLKDKNINLAVLGEGESTFNELVAKILENQRKLPAEEALKQIPGIAFLREKDKIRHNREIILLDQLDEGLERVLPESPQHMNSPNDLAYIIYTSGSTGRPKGVMVQHDSVVNQLEGLVHEFKLDFSFRYLLLASFTFDVSVMHIFLPLVTGAKLFLVSEEVKKDSEKLWAFIARNKINILNIVPTFMQVLLKYIEKGTMAFKYLFVGGDVFPAELYRQLQETFTVEKIINIYGPTETTINAAKYECNNHEPGAVGVIPIGKPLANYFIYILDKSLNSLPLGGTGELCICGKGVARGHLNNPELTAEKFLILTAKTREGTRRINMSSMFYLPSVPSLAKKIYRTGDLARWFPDGNIEFLGRIDRQVKIRGFRIELGEIENHLSSIQGIKESVVVDMTDKDGEKYVCAYFTAGVEFEAVQLRDYLSKRVPSYMIPAHFVQLDKIPLTHVGKVDKKALPAPAYRKDESFRAPGNEVEEKLARLWAEVIGIEKEIIGTGSNFFELGGHSLKATILVSRLHKEFNTKVSLAQFFIDPTIKGLAHYIKEAGENTFKSIEAVEKRDYYQLSSTQKRLYFVQRMDEKSTAYNLPEVIYSPEEFDITELENTFKKLIKHHESLRTSFHMVVDEPVQKIHEENFKLQITILPSKKRRGSSISNSGSQITNIIKDFIRSFDLSQAPLLRVGLIKTGEAKHILLVDMHHIITDGVSHEILTKDFMSLYMNNHQELPRLKLQYKDYVEWQVNEEEKGTIRKQEEYWLNRFKNAVPALNIPSDYSLIGTSKISAEGGSIFFEIDTKPTEKIKKFALATGCTPFVLLLAAYTILLSKYTLREDIVVGTTIAGRRHTDFQNIIGMFVNMLAMRNFPQTHKTFREFYLEVKKNFLDAFENQDYQFDRLVMKLGLQGKSLKNPLVETVFVFDSNLHQEDPGEQKHDVFGNPEAKFDLTLGAVERKEKIRFDFEYRSRLFKIETIERMSRHYINILEEIAENPDIRLSDIRMLGSGESSRIMKTIETGDIPVESREAGFDF